MPRNKRICDTDKNRLHQSHMENRDYLQLAKCLNIQANSARAIVLSMSKRQGIPSLPSGGSVYKKVDDKMRDEFQNILEEFPSMTLLEINRALRNRKPNKPNVTLNYISKYLDGMLITKKKAYLHLMQSNSETNKIKGRDYNN